MINDQAILRNYLAAASGVKALTGSRIYASRNVPIEGWKPSAGACLVFKRRGDLPLDESGMAISASYQVKCYGGGGNLNQQLVSAQALYRAVYDVLNFGTSYNILGSQKEGGGDVLTEPDTDFPYVLAFFRVQLRKTA